MQINKMDTFNGICVNNRKKKTITELKLVHRNQHNFVLNNGLFNKRLSWIAQ